ncbi:iron ABC transporter permease [Micromonospora sp. WMMD1102]|uniref:FecCD family ABC transporter permease n=1 Tax=Micromonospora sp. WMMD1102 TaxID=3016105 RepID=UPI0024152D24|nr:iron ABC transporter permease [Micromonospora sp. WMMD1102]MDG4785030.1 iron ABC transporter permease [Micromonospora sp. WMMD1102]
MTATRHPDVSVPTRPGRRRRSTWLIYAALTGLLVAGLAGSVLLGTVDIPADTIARIIVWHLTGHGDPTAWSASQDTVVWNLRLPRALLAALVGAGLAVSGAATQALVRNPLADPYVLGLTYGGAVGAVAVIVTGVTPLGAATPGLAAFVGALGAFAVVYTMARAGGTLAPLRLVLAGMAVTYALSGVTSFLVLQADDPGTTHSVLFWLFGSLAEANWAALGLPAAVLTVAVIALLAQARPLNALLLGDETAASLGIPAARIRRHLFLIIALLTGVMVALAGGIGFIGLIIPHATRLLVGSDHRRLLPLAALAGAAFLVAVDIAARTALHPQELPVGVVTSIIGAPLFLWLVHTRARDTTGL